MKFSINQQEFKNKSIQALRFVSPKPQLPILACFLISTEDNKLSISSTDLQEGIRIRMSGSIAASGNCAVPAKVLVEILSTLDDEEITCEVKEKVFLLKCKKNTARLQTFPVNDFPTFPEKEGEKIDLPKKLLRDVIDKVAFASGRDETRPILTSVLISIGKSSKIVATDGFRLAVLESSFKSPLEQEMLFSSRIIQEAVKIIFEEDGETVQVYVSKKLKQGFFVGKQIEIVVRLMEGEYPKYEAILPPAFAVEVLVEKEALEKSIKSAQVFAKESSGIIKFELNDKVLTVSASSSSLGEFQSDLEIKSAFQGSSKIAFNGKYISEFLQKMDCKEIWFKMNDELKPGLFAPEDDSTYQYLVMPFKVS